MKISEIGETFDKDYVSRISFFSEIEYRNISVGGKDKKLKKYDGTASVVVNANGAVVG